MSDDFVENAKKHLHDQGVEAAILDKLIESDMKKKNIVVTDDEINKFVAEMASTQNMSFDDLKSLIESQGQDFDMWKKRMQLDKRIAIDKLIEIRGLGKMEIDDTEALDYYNANKDSFNMPEQVKASHILITPDTSDPNMDPNKADAIAREKAEKLLKEIKDGADFAELAKANSDCPSSRNGGDLGFAERGNWVKPFSDAAFALEQGQVSNIVKTQFGYHIIKVTDRKNEGLQSFDEVKDNITKWLKGQKQQDLMKKYFELIKSEAKIVYPPGKEPLPESEMN